MKASRVFQLTTLALVLVSVVQVGWWLFDQRSYARTRWRLRGPPTANRCARRGALLAAGTPAAEVEQLLPKIHVSDGRAALAPEVATALANEERSRQRQYAWEGSFFLLALGSASR